MESIYIRAITDFVRSEIESVCTLTHPLTFQEDVREITQREKPASTHDVTKAFDVFCLIGHIDEVDEAFSSIVRNVKHHFETCTESEDAGIEANSGFYQGTSRSQLLTMLYLESVPLLQDFRFPVFLSLELDDDFLIVVFSSCGDLDDADIFEDCLLQWIDSWIAMEQPLLCEKQVVTRSFDLGQLRNRRVIAPHYDSQTNQWELFLDGANRVQLGCAPQLLPVDSDVLSRWTTSDIRQIVTNPIYCFGVHLNYSDRYADWYASFIYWCSTRLSEETDAPETILALYKRFLSFMMDRFGYTRVDPVIPEQSFATVLYREINDVRHYLAGVLDEEGYGRSLVSTMPWRVYFLIELSMVFGLQVEISQKASTNDAEYTFLLRECLESSATDSPAIKGQRFETLTRALLDQVNGIRLTGKRIRSGGCEIDLCYSNVSLNKSLWEMGALILVECKHWNKPLGISVLRNLVYVMHSRGCSTGILASFSGFTDVVANEVRFLACSGIHVLLLSKEDFMKVDEGCDAFDLLVSKLDALLKYSKDDFRLLM